MLLTQVSLAKQIGKFAKKIVLPASVVVATGLFVAGQNSALAQKPARGGKAIMRGDSGSFKRGDIIVTLAPGTSEDAMKASLADKGLQFGRALRVRGFYLLTMNQVNGADASDDATKQKVIDLKASALFRSVNHNFIYRTMDTTPNDPRYNLQWGYPLINLPKAWDLAKGTSDVVCVSLDTGVDVNHPDLAGRFIGTRNFTVQPNTSDVTDNFGHGTHTTGTMTASTNNGVGVAGASYGINPIFVGKVLGDNGSGSSSDIGDAVVYVADNVKTNSNQVVINMSLGAYVSSDDPDLTDPLEAAVVYAAQQRNVIVSMSAGNAFDGGNPAASPARTAQLDARLFCVASCGRQKEHAFYSEARAYTTITAPGGNDPDLILSTLPVNQGSYGYEEGTSMAAPHIAGVVALMLGTGVPPDQVKGIMTQTADSVGLKVPNAEYGYGVVDAYAAIVVAVSGIKLSNPLDGKFVYGITAVTLVAGDPAKYLGSKLTVDADPASVATADAQTYILNWDTAAKDSTSGAPKYANGTHKISITVTTPTGPVVFNRTVRVDNPIASFSSPDVNGYVTKTATISGTADGLRVPSFTLDYATSAAPTTWVNISPKSTARIQGGALSPWTIGSVPDQLVTLRLTVANPDGYSVQATRVVTVDQTTPSIPTNLAGQSSNRTATLNWTPSTDPAPGLLTGYNIYRSQKSLTGFTKINTSLLTSPAYSDGNLTNAFTYFYKVTALDAAGNESSPADAVSVTPNRNGTAAGTVTDLNGTFLNAVSVLLQQGGTTVANGTASTDPTGQYAFPSPPGFTKGTYTLRADLAGYVSQLVNGVSVDLGRDATAQNFVLQPQPTLTGTWTLLTLPYDFAGADLTSVYANIDARYYDPISATYVAPGNPAFVKPAPGVGYWIARAGGTPSVIGAGVPNAPVTAVKVPIRVGWNMLGNPFQSTIRWVLNNLTITRADNNQQATLDVAVGLGWALDFAWGGRDGHTLLFDRTVVPGVSDAIPGYGGFWFFSSVDGWLSIAPPSIIGRSASNNSAQWALPINAKSGDATSTVYVGVGAKSRVFSTAPSLQTNFKMGIVPASSSSTTRNAVDIRNVANGSSWDVVVDSSGDRPVTLSWPNSSALPRGWTLALVDVATGNRVNLRTSSGYTLPAGRASNRVQLELTRESYNRMLITDAAVTANRGTVPAISFNLAKEGTTTVTILKASGETVRNVSTRAAKVGQNSIVWDTRDNEGKAVAPGMYLIQIKAVGDKGDTARAVVPYVVTR